MQLLLTPVELTLPADSRLMRVARLVATGVATTCGLPLDAVEDFRIVVDEVCSALLEANDTGSFRLAFWVERGALMVEGSTDTALHREPDAARLALSDQLLDTLADSHQLHHDGQRLTFLVSTPLRANGVG